MGFPPPPRSALSCVYSLSTINFSLTFFFHCFLFNFFHKFQTWRKIVYSNSFWDVTLKIRVFSFPHKSQLPLDQWLKEAIFFSSALSMSPTFLHWLKRVFSARTTKWLGDLCFSVSFQSDPPPFKIVSIYFCICISVDFICFDITRVRYQIISHYFISLFLSF